MNDISVAWFFIFGRVYIYTVYRELHSYFSHNSSSASSFEYAFGYLVSIW